MGAGSAKASPSKAHVAYKMGWEKYPNQWLANCPESVPENMPPHFHEHRKASNVRWPQQQIAPQQGEADRTEAKGQPTAREFEKKNSALAHRRRAPPHRRVDHSHS